MEYLSINEFLTLDDNGLEAYINWLIEDKGCNLSVNEDLRRLRELGEYNTESITLDFINGYLLGNYDTIDFSFPVYQVFSDTTLRLFYYTINDRQRYTILVPESFKEKFIREATLLEADEEADIPSLEECENTLSTLNSEELEKIIPYLEKIGVRNRSQEVKNTIPLNSESLLQDDSTARFSSAVWYEEIQKKVVILAGVGGIGSYVAFLLARMKPRSLFLYDDDDVEFVNMSGQLYSFTDVGKKKVNAIANMISNYARYNSVFAIPEKFTEDCEASDIMICGFDNMQARKTFFKKWLIHVNSKSEEEQKHCLFIDGRLAAEELQVFCIQGNDDYNKANYENYLFSDDEADETVCSYKQTTFMANMIGSIIVNLFTNFVANEIMEGLRDLPFKTSFEAESMMFKTEN